MCVKQKTNGVWNDDNAKNGLVTAVLPLLRFEEVDISVSRPNKDVERAACKEYFEFSPNLVDNGIRHNDEMR